MYLMTQLLERAYAEVAQLPEPEQDIIAALILGELEDERKWQKNRLLSSPTH